MAVNFSSFVTPQTDWGGLYKVADTLEQRRQRDERLTQQREGRKHASAQFLQNYLDPKDYMSGTAYDPMVVQGLNEAMSQGMELAAKGVDTPTLMMALGPMVKKLSDYSTRAKTLNATVDDQIKKMQQSDAVGYDYAALKREAMKSAMFDTDPQTGKSTLNPNKADASVDWLGKVIQDSPELVTTDAALDEFAKKSSMNKTLSDIQQYDAKGELNRRKVHLVGQNWLVPEVDDKGATTALVPKHELAYDEGKPLMHPFKDAKSGKVTDAQVRVLDEELFDRLPASAMNRIKALTKEAIKGGEYKVDGKSITLDDPRAKLVARGIAYDELNRRKASTIESAGIVDKPSSAQINLNVNNTPEGLQYVENRAEAAKRGRANVQTPEEAEKALKKNTGEAIGEIFKNNQDFISGPGTQLKGKATPFGGGDLIDVEGKNVVDVTSALPGGGIKVNKAEGYDYEKVYYDPQSRSLVLQKATGTGYSKKTKQEIVPEDKVGQFINQIAESNGIPRAGVRKLLDDIGYKGGKFSGAGAPPAAPAAPPTVPEHIKKLDSFGKDGGVGKLSGFKGKFIGADQIQDISGIYNPLNKNDYRVKLKDANGKTITKEFATKEELKKYLESAGVKAPTTRPSIPADLKGILD